MSDMTLIKILEAQVNESDTTSFEVGEQRERNMRFYSLQPIGNEIPGRSAYISPDVLDAVESKKSIFSETFLSSRQVVKFSASGVPMEAEAKTAYANKVFKRNDSDSLFRDAWHDAFVGKRCVVLAEWTPDTKDQIMDLQGAPVPMIEQQLQQMGEQLKGMDGSGLQMQQVPGPQGPMQVATGQLTLQIDDSYTKLQLIKPENFYRDPEATYVKDSMWCTVEESISRGMLTDMGYEYEQIMGLKLDYRWRRNDEDFARKAHDSSWTQKGRTSRVDSQENVSFSRTWTWLTPEDFEGVDTPGFEPAEGFNLYEIHWCHGEVLRWEAEPVDAQSGQEPQEAQVAIRKVDQMPFFEWSEMKISHAEHGMCTSDVVSFTQKSQSGLKRLVYDNQSMANSSRTLALSGALKNPRDLLDNKIGATIWTKRMDAVTSLPTPQLSPLTMDVIQLFKQDGEERSGMSSLAKGMNSDAVKNQNADDMVARLTNAGTRRVTADARDFAGTFLVPLSQYIVKLGKENDKTKSSQEYAGQQIPIIPAQWQDEENTMEIAVALTPDEGALMSQKMLTMHGMISQDPEMAISYGVEQKHAVFDMIYDFMGITDTSKILLAPSDPAYAEKAQQQQQAAQMEQQKADQAAQVQLGLTDAQAKALQSQDQREWAKFSWDQTDDMADNLLNEQKQSWTEDIQQQEIDLEAKLKSEVTVQG